MDFVVLWTESAATDLRSIVQYISQDDPEAARALAVKIIERIEPSSAFPKTARVVPERDVDSLREIVFSPYRIILNVDSQRGTVHVLRVWHAARGEPRV